MEEYMNSQTTNLDPTAPVPSNIGNNTEWQQPLAPSSKTGLEDAMLRMTLRPRDSMDAPYPERAGEPDCPYYMRTGLCGFGSNCKFNHPASRRLAVGVPWTRGDYPERVGEPECQYYLKTGTCKFGATCKFHHPRDKGVPQLNVLNLPLRPGEKDCPYYLRTGTCKYEVTCKFNHPQPLIPLGPSPMYPAVPSGSVSTPQLYHPTLPAWRILPYSSHPSIAGPSGFTPVVLPSRQGVVSMQPWNPYLNQAQLGSMPEGPPTLPGSFIYGGAAVSSRDTVGVGLYPSFLTGTMNMRLSPNHVVPSGQNETLYPERPGQPECQYYMKNGECKFGLNCKFHHPRDRIGSTQGSHVNTMTLPSRPV